MTAIDLDLERLRKRARNAGIADWDIGSKAELENALEDLGDRIVEPPGQPLPNARRFIKAELDHPEMPLLVHQGGAFYRWDGACWPDVDDAELRAQLYKWFDDKNYIAETANGPEQKPFAPNRYKVADLVDAMRAVSHISVSTPTPSWFSGAHMPADELVACVNGLVHVPSRTLHQHTPRYYTHPIDFEFDPAAPAPERFLAFLNDLWPDDVESISTLQEMLGYMISGDTTLQKMFLIVGPRRSGKGTIARILKVIMGTHHVAGPTLASLGTNFGLSPLIGKPVAIVADARLKTNDTSVVTERLLSISGEDTLTVDRKYKEPWTGQIGVRFIVLSNELPRLSDSSGALASRFIVLTMLNSFYGRENPNLTAELSTELPGIFNWALDGLERLRERGYFLQPTSSQEAIRELEDLGSPVGAFIRDRCEIGPEHRVARDHLYLAWQQWCESHGRRPSAAETFGRDVRAAVPGLRTERPRTDDGSRYRAYLGIGLVQAGPGTSPMYSQQSGPRGMSGSSDNSGVDHGPTWTTDSACDRCSGEGCDWCGDWKRSDGSRYRAYQGIGLAQAGTCATPMYSQQSEGPDDSSHNIEPAHVPTCATADAYALDENGEVIIHVGMTELREKL